MGKKDRRPRSASRETDIADKFTVVVDPDAQPVDWDEAVATFLLACVQKRHEDEEAAQRRGGKMGPEEVKSLEEELEIAIGRVVRRLAKARQIDLLPPKRIYHLMAKAAVSVHEAVDEVSEKG